MATGAAVLALSATPAAAATTTTTTVPIGSFCSSTGQLCTPASAAGSYDSLSPLSVTYTAAGTHCSNVAVRLLVDGHQAASTGFAPPAGSVSTTVPWPNDGKAHELSVEGEGETGGCNAGRLEDWAGELTITYTPAVCRVAMRSGGSDQCCSISVEGRAHRDPTSVVAGLSVDRGGASRCQRKPVSAEVDGQPVRLKFNGSHGTGSATMTATRAVCSDSLFARVSQGGLSASDEFTIPNSTPDISTFRATRNSAGQLQVAVVVRHVLPTARCQRPSVTVDGDVVRLRVHGSEATAHRAVIAGKSCESVATLQYQQDKVTAHATRTATGTVPTMCKAPAP